MRCRMWMVVGVTVITGATSALAQEKSFPNLDVQIQQSSGTLQYRQRPAPYCPTPAAPPAQLAPPQATPAGQPTPAAQPAPTDDLLQGEGQSKNIAGIGAMVSSGTGLSSAASTSVLGQRGGGTLASSNSTTSVLSPLILPGLFTALSAQSAVPLDRVSFDYGYFNAFQVTDPVTGGNRSGFNLNTYIFSAEKTFLDSSASVYVNVPVLLASNNTSGQAINGLGDINVGMKYILWKNNQTGSLFTTGFTASVPTGRSSQVTTFSRTIIDQTTILQGVVQPNVHSDTGLVPVSSTSLNPVYLQPWVAALASFDRWFIHDYFSVIVPTDDRVATFLNNSVTTGYTFRNSGSWVSSITPIVGAQLLLPVNYRVASSANTTSSPIAITQLTPPPAPFPATPAPTAAATPGFGFSDQLFVSGGMQIGLGNSAMFSVGVVVPVLAPAGYSIGGTCGLTFAY